MDTMVKNAPAGTESAVAVLKSALASSQSAIESAQNTAKKALAMAESNGKGSMILRLAAGS
jgi:hypothetical protein